MSFFGPGSADLSQQGRKWLGEAFSGGGVCSIDPSPTIRRSFHVIGHADGSGSAAANEQLGLRRAQNVADYLIELGVAREYICVSSKGSKSLLVRLDSPEPQNRRVAVEVTLLKPGQEPCQ